MQTLCAGARSYMLAAQQRQKKQNERKHVLATFVALMCCCPLHTYMQRQQALQAYTTLYRTTCCHQAVKLPCISAGIASMR